MSLKQGFEKGMENIEKSDKKLLEIFRKEFPDFVPVREEELSETALDFYKKELFSGMHNFVKYNDGTEVISSFHDERVDGCQYVIGIVKNNMFVKFSFENRQIVDRAIKSTYYDTTITVSVKDDKHELPQKQTLKLKRDERLLHFHPRLIAKEYFPETLSKLFEKYVNDKMLTRTPDDLGYYLAVLEKEKKTQKNSAENLMFLNSIESFQNG